MVPISKYGVTLQVDQNSKIYNVSGKLLRVALNSTGYPRISITYRHDGHNRQRNLFVHHLVLEAFVSPRPEGKVANHKDGKKMNANVDNLEWITQSENLKHAIRIGLKRVRVGREHARAIYPQSTIDHALSLKGKMSTRKAAKLTGLGKSYIHFMWTRPNDRLGTHSTQEPA